MINKFGIYNNYYSWWKNIDKTILILVVSFFIAGLFFSLASTSLIASDRLNTNSYYFFVKHLSFILLGLLIMFIFSLIKEEFLIKVSIIFFVISLFLLFLVPFIGAEVKGSKRWLDLPFLPRFQPVELIKPFYIVILASLLNFQKYNLYFKYFLSLLLVVPIVLLLISQPDLGQSMLIILTWLALIFVSGINPHAGDNGEIGNEEINHIKPAIECLQIEGLNVSGPYPADTLFNDRTRARYDVAVCMYHDQALIPVKSLSFQEVVNVTLGIDFIRTSPDHGTALDIAGKNLANYKSLLKAIEMAKILIK